MLRAPRVTSDGSQLGKTSLQSIVTRRCAPLPDFPLGESKRGWGESKRGWGENHFPVKSNPPPTVSRLHTKSQTEFGPRTANNINFMRGTTGSPSVRSPDVSVQCDQIDRNFVTHSVTHSVTGHPLGRHCARTFALSERTLRCDKSRDIFFLG